jgi:hypothetical protein
MMKLNLVLIVSLCVVLSCTSNLGTSQKSEVIEDSTDEPPDVTSSGLEPDTNELLDAEAEVELASSPDLTPLPACILVNPSAVNFGGKKYGEMAVVPVEVGACGEVPLEIYAVRIAEGSSPDFGLYLPQPDRQPSQEEPLVVEPGHWAVFNIKFTPDAINPSDSEGDMIIDQGALLIESNAEVPVKEVKLSGYAACLCCPTAIIKCEEGDEVIPQTLLHLHGDESYGPHEGHDIVKWEWKVDQPTGSTSLFIPAADYPNPTFETNVAGIYTFYLTIYDETKTPSCFPAEHEVAVVGDQAIHVELLWHTPQDQDETDTGPEAGSDLDLHFLHPSATGADVDGDAVPDGWFDTPWDCHFFNAHPNWGSLDPGINDDPGLDRDDTDGAGPENLNLAMPEDFAYRVGVHYWKDHGYGAAFATVRVYIYSQMVFEAADVQLHELDLWEVGTLNWQSAIFDLATDSAGQYVITPGFEVLDFGDYD